MLADRDSDNWDLFTSITAARRRDNKHDMIDNVLYKSTSEIKPK